MGFTMINDDTVVTMGMLRKFHEDAANESRKAVAEACVRTLRDAKVSRPLSQIWIDHTPKLRKVQ